MRNIAVLLVAVLAAGCAGFDDNSYMPTADQLKWRNPRLLNCPPGSVATCDAVGGGRVGKRYINCHCAGRPF